MRILLYNQNPVVEKLVTLSAKKTSDDIINIRSTDELIEESVDLLLVDDDAFILDENCYDRIKEKIEFKKSCLIASRDSNPRDDFDDILYKPFLPTDLVKELERLNKETLAIEPEIEEEEVIAGLDLEGLDETDHSQVNNVNNEELNLEGLLENDEEKPDEIDLDQALKDLDTPEEDEIDLGEALKDLDTPEADEINLGEASLEDLDSVENELNSFLDSVNSAEEKVETIEPVIEEKVEIS